MDFARLSINLTGVPVYGAGVNRPTNGEHPADAEYRMVIRQGEDPCAPETFVFLRWRVQPQ